MNANEIICDTIGAWGFWQKRTVFLIFLCKITACWCMAVILFTAPYPKQISVKCINQTESSVLNAWAEESENEYNVLHPEQIDLNDKQFYIGLCDARDDYAAHVDIARSRKQVIDKNIERNITVVTCDSLVYKANYLDKETDYDLVCSRNLVAAFTQFFHLAGVLFGGLIGMVLLNFISPKNLILVGMLGQISTGFGLAFGNEFEIQLLLRFLCSVSCAKMYTAGQVIMIDIIGKGYHKIVLPLFESFWSIGVILIPIIAHHSPSWKSLYISITVPTIAYLMVWFLIADSPIWHLCKGNKKRAIAIILDATTVNKKSYLLPNNFLDDLQVNKFNEKPSHVKYFIMWRENFLNTFLIHVVWGVIITSFNGLLLNTRAFGTKDLHRNIMLTGISELIGVAFAYSFILQSTRKWLWTGLLNILVGFLVVILFLTLDEEILNKYSTLVIAVNLLVKVMVAASLMLLLSSTGELVELSKRKTLQLSCLIWGRCCLLTASFIGSLTLVSALLPFAVFSVMIIISGFALCIINPNLNQIVKKKLNRKEIELKEIEKLTMN